MKPVKGFILAVIEAFTSTLRINTTSNVEVDFDVLAAKSAEQIETEAHESLNVIIQDYHMTIAVKRMFIGLACLLTALGLYLVIGRNWYAAFALFFSAVCYKFYENRKHIGDAKHSFIQFTISNEVESEKAKKIPGYQMRNPGIYEDNLS